MLAELVIIVSSHSVESVNCLKFNIRFILTWHFRNRFLKVKVDSICTVNPETSNIISSNTEYTQNKTLSDVLDIEGGETYKLTTQRFDKV